MHGTTHIYPDDARRAWKRGNALGHFRVLSDEDALTPARVFTHVHGGDHHDDHIHTRDNARSVNPDDVHMANASHASPPPRPRRTHGTPGSYSSPGTPWHSGTTPQSHQFTKDLNDVISTPHETTGLLTMSRSGTMMRLTRRLQVQRIRPDRSTRRAHDRESTYGIVWQTKNSILISTGRLTMG
jgi:hypothetical protein